MFILSNLFFFFFSVVWVVSLMLAAPPLGGWGEYRFLENQSFCFCNWKLSQSYTFFMIGICFCVPCLVMSFCYVRIIKSVRKSNRRLMSLDQRLSASFADMESDNPQSDLPSASSQMPEIPEKLKALTANGTRLIVDPLCARKLTDYAKTLKQSIELQKRASKKCPSSKDLQEDNSIEPGLRSPTTQRNHEPYTININDFAFSVSPESESGDNLDSPPRNLTNGSLKNLNNSYDTILTVSSPENQSQDDIESDRGENGHLCVQYGSNKSSGDEQKSREIFPSTGDSVSSPSLPGKISELSNETESQNNNSVRSSDEMLEAESVGGGSGEESGDEADEEKENEEQEKKEKEEENEVYSERQLGECISKETESSCKIDEKTVCSLCSRTLGREVSCSCWAHRTSREKSRTFPTTKMPVMSYRNKRVTISNSSRHRKHKKSSGGKRSNPFSLSTVKFAFDGTARKSNSAVPSRYLRRRREEIRITFSLLVVIIVFFVSWLPFCITMLCSLYCKSPVPRTADIISLFFGYANSCFNPLIYGLMNRRFSDAYKQLFKSMFYRKCIKR